jgi:predicted AAA+ superfamily ATPase
MWIERNNSKRIIEATKTRPVLLLTGIRQAGKSSLLQRIFPDAEYVTLDKVLLAEEAEQNPANFLNRFKGQVIIDEVQYAPSLFIQLKLLVDKNRQLKGKWILTGSQQFSLMEKISESLAGRISIINMGTLSADELVNAGFDQQKNDMLWKGGFPEVWAELLNPKEFYEDYIQTYLERDLRQIIKVSSLFDFRRFLALVAHRTGQLVKYSDISKDLGVAVNTVKSWISALETSGILIMLPPYYKNLGKRLIKTPKLYFSDNGLAAHLLNINSLAALHESIYKGNLFENFVATEFLKNGLKPGRDLFYYRDQNGVEMDFIIEENTIHTLVEAKFTEQPDKRKLNFDKVAPLFKDKTNCVLACAIEEKGLFHLRDYKVYNPLFGYPF